MIGGNLAWQLAGSIFLFTACMAAWGQSSTVWIPVMRWSSAQIRCPDESTKAWLIKSAAGGNTESQDRLGTLKLSSCKDMYDAVEGVRLLELAAGKGNAHAQLALGEAYRFGRLGHVDNRKAVTWFNRAALQDNPGAQNNFGMALYFGLGVARNVASAARMFRIAAQQNLREAAYNLATLYDRGQGIDQSYENARRWYEKAADQDDGAAEYRLGMLCEQGLGGETDSQAATDWFQKAAHHGSVPAMIRLGLESGSDTQETAYSLYAAGTAMLYGNGVPKDEAQALVFLKKSADRGYVPALFQLAQVYSDGLGVKRDAAKAIDYYEKVIAGDSTNYAAYNNIAWVRVTSKDPKIRNPQKALDYALKAVELSGGKESNELDTLANAYFQIGQVDKAIETETTALALEPEKDIYLKTLAQFKNAKEHPRAAK